MWNDHEFVIRYNTPDGLESDYTNDINYAISESMKSNVYFDLRLLHIDEHGDIIDSDIYSIN